MSASGGLGGAWCAHCYVFTKSDAAGRLNAHPLRDGECPGSHHTGFGTVPMDTPPCDRPAAPSPSWLRVVAPIEAADPCRDLRAENARLTAELSALREAVRVAACDVASAASQIDAAFSGPVQDDAHEALDLAVDALLRAVTPPAAPGGSA